MLCGYFLIGSFLQASVSTVSFVPRLPPKRDRKEGTSDFPYFTNPFPGLLVFFSFSKLLYKVSTLTDFIFKLN